MLKVYKICKDILETVELPSIMSGSEPLFSGAYTGQMCVYTDKSVCVEIVKSEDHPHGGKTIDDILIEQDIDWSLPVLGKRHGYDIRAAPLGVPLRVWLMLNPARGHLLQVLWMLAEAIRRCEDAGAELFFSTGDIWILGGPHIVRCDQVSVQTDVCAMFRPSPKSFLQEEGYTVRRRPYREMLKLIAGTHPDLLGEIAEHREHDIFRYLSDSIEEITFLMPPYVTSEHDSAFSKFLTVGVGGGARPMRSAAETVCARCLSRLESLENTDAATEIKVCRSQARSLSKYFPDLAERITLRLASV